MYMPALYAFTIGIGRECCSQHVNSWSLVAWTVYLEQYSNLVQHSCGDHCRCRGGVVGLLEHLVSGGVWGVGVRWCLNQKTKVPSPEVRFLKGF